MAEGVVEQERVFRSTYLALSAYVKRNVFRPKAKTDTQRREHAAAEKAANV